VVDVASVAGRLGQRLHDAGLPVGPDISGRLAAALLLTPPATVTELYWLARVTLVAEHRHLATFDGVFDEIFRGTGDPAGWRGQDRADPPVPAPVADPDRPTGPAPVAAASARTPVHRPTPLVTPGVGRPDGRAAADALLAAASPEERLRSQDFSTLTDDELATLRVLMAQMMLSLPPRRGRRTVTAPAGRDLDLRATLRRARRTGGDPAELIRLRRRPRPRRLVLICDISGSMHAYARAYLQLLLSGVGGARAEAFVFATRLTRLTPALRAAHPDAALARATRTAPDWSGGTRIGESLQAFIDGYGRRGLARGAVVVILSDGWECGDPALLGRELGRLQRLAHRVIWVNPRSAGPQFRPQTAGMRAVLPHVDGVCSGHSVAALQELLNAIRDDQWGQKTEAAGVRPPG
jgi:uncharacterized protein with von Willebrand factor type A (vWA) domain